jgi:ElaB/YqjD/DUF883 family membrane-anchored ribosome-binding protein
MEKSNDSQTSAQCNRIRSEADFLAEQAAAAERALSDTLLRMRADLGQSADLAAWARQYPWQTMGIAAAAGFLAVTTIGGSASSRTEESSSPLRESNSPDPPPNQSARGTETGRSLLQTLMSELLRNFATAAQGALLAAIGSRFQQPSAPPNHTPPEGVPPVADPTVVSANDGNGFTTSDA